MSGVAGKFGRGRNRDGMATVVEPLPGAGFRATIIVAAVLCMAFAMAAVPTLAAAADGDGRLYFASGGIIRSMNPDGSDVMQTLSGAGPSDHPSVAADGSRIAFSSRRDTPSASEIFVMDPDGSNVKRLSF